MAQVVAAGLRWRSSPGVPLTAMSEPSSASCRAVTVPGPAKCPSPKRPAQMPLACGGHPAALLGFDARDLVGLTPGAVLLRGEIGLAEAAGSVEPAEAAVAWGTAGHHGRAGVAVVLCRQAGQVGRHTPGAVQLGADEHFRAGAGGVCADGGAVARGPADHLAERGVHRLCAEFGHAGQALGAPGSVLLGGGVRLRQDNVAGSAISSPPAVQVPAETHISEKMSPASSVPAIPLSAPQVPFFWLKAKNSPSVSDW